MEVIYCRVSDFDKLKKNAQKLEGASLQLEQVSVSNCIYVANYDESLGKDTIELYFENTPRSGGGQVEKVWFNENEGYWLVYFADYKGKNILCRAQDKLHVYISIFPISSPNPMFDHLLELSHQDDSNKWSNIGFGEELTQVESIEVHFTHFIWTTVSACVVICVK